MGEEQVADELTAFCSSAYPRLVRTLDLYCGDVGVAEELAQETLARVWRHWKKVRVLEQPEGWAHHVGLNLARSWLRRRRAEQRARERLTSRAGAATPPPDATSDLAVREAIAALPHRMKTALILRYFLDLPFEEVARLMDAPQGTVRSLVHRAIERLRNEPLIGEEEVGNVV
jgi:RNA polymerase sigma-70 factor (sigma-E family)